MAKKRDLPRGIGSVSMRVHRTPKGWATKDRWKDARLKKSIWEKYNPESELGVKEFFKKENALDNSIDVYNMSVQVDYDSKAGGLSIDSQTFEVITLKGAESENGIYENVKESYSNMLFENTGDTFNPGFQEAIKRNTNIRTEEIRGFEELDKNSKPKLKSEDYQALLEGRYIVKDLNPNLRGSKNKKGNKSGNFKVKLDLSNFM